jgi:prepilin-type N-terminal cleavage/methylation domain-containing protein
MLIERLRGERGVTLMELMVTLMVVAILFGLAIPTIQHQIARQELRASAREVTEVLRSARDSAVNTGAPRYVLFTPGFPGSYRQFRYNGTAWVAERPRVSLGGRIGFTSSTVTFPALSNTPQTGVSVPAAAAYFDTRGRYPFGFAGPYTITLQGAMDQTITLTLHAQTGQVTGAT